MSLVEQYRGLARYNTWMNAKLYALAADALRRGADARPRRVLRVAARDARSHPVGRPHLALALHADQEIGLSRDRDGNPSRSACTIRSSTRSSRTCAAERAKTDRHIEAWVAGLTPETLAGPIAYSSMNGGAREHPLWQAVTHFFNHETHHRGQATTLFRQLGRDPGVTDFMVFLREEHDRQSKP